MNKNQIKTIALLIVITGALFSALSFMSVHFNPDPSLWFTANYYLQFIPLYISVTFLLSGLFILTGYSRVNFYLAVFGHATSEEIIFSLIGITSSPLPTYAMVIFLPSSIAALWVAYTNPLKKKKISISEAIFGVLFSTAFILLPRYI